MSLAYTMVGDGRMSPHFGIPKSIDLLEAVRDMNALEKVCFFTIKNSIKWDRFDNKYIYQVNVDMSQLSKSQQSKFRAGYALLSAKDLVRRISRGVYMINPTALIPTDFEREFAIWSNAKPQQSLTNTQ